jgi:magnesium transporter
MNTIFVHRDGRTEQVTSIERSWLSPPPGSNAAYLWVDLSSPSIPESLVLSDTFAFHRLAVDAARLARHSPTIDAYDGYLYAAMAGADADVSFFVGAHYIVSVHWAESQAVADLIDSVRHGGKQFVEGPFAMFHRLADAMTAAIGPTVEKLAASAATFEKRLLDKAGADAIATALQARREAFAWSQRLSAQRDAVDRLVRREVVDISAEMAFRFRDVRNQLARMLDDTRAIEHRLGDVLTVAGAARKSWL